jgi:HEAT repeat protein
MRRQVVAVALAVLVGPVARGDELGAVREELRSPSEARAIDAAKKLAEDTSPAATDAILDELAVGAPPKVQAELLAGLIERKDPRALDVLIHYTQNRNPALRKKAVVALAAIPDARPEPSAAENTDQKSGKKSNKKNEARTDKKPDARAAEKPAATAEAKPAAAAEAKSDDKPGAKIVPTLIAVLSDSVEEVRAAAARALAGRGDHSTAVEDALIKLLEHKDAAAVSALGALGGPGTARRLGELSGQVPDGLLANTFAELLHRADFGPDPIRVEVVKALGKLTGPEATAALRDYIAETETDKARPSRGEAKKLIEQRGAQ